MHAPKHDFFYVLDRATGELLSAQNFVPNTKDLRFMKPQENNDFNAIVLGGKFKDRGMAPSPRRSSQLA
jgi:hypothetical protein